MSSFEIYLDDLTEEAKERYFDFIGTDENDNFEYSPIAIVDSGE